MIITQHWPNFDRVLMIDVDTQSTLFIDIEEDKDYEYRKTAWLWNLYVKEEYREQGIATKLIKDAEQAAKKNGCVVALLKWNEAMSTGFTRAWYTRLGYTKKETGEGYIIYEKIL